VKRSRIDSWGDPAIPGGSPGTKSKEGGFITLRIMLQGMVASTGVRASQRFRPGAVHSEEFCIDPMLTRLIHQALFGNRELQILDQDVQIAFYLFGGIAD
jgi:hypothetical protein